MEFDNLKNLWKTQKFQNKGPGDNQEIFDLVYKMEKKTRMKYIISTTAMCIELAFFLFLIFRQDFFTGFSLAGIILVIVAIMLGISSLWGTTILFKKNDLVNPGLHFFKDILEKLNRRKYMRVYLIPVYLVMIAFGITLIFSERLSGITLLWKILIYTVTYLYIVVVYIFTARKEIRKEKNEIEPIRKKISAIIVQMESE